MPPEQDPELVPLNPGFDVVWHGFDRAQVYQYIEEVDGNVRLLAADRDAALSQVDELTEALQSARSEISKLHQRIDELCKGPHSEEDLDDRLRRMVRLANSQADEIIARAQAAAEHSLATTEEMSSNLRARYTKLLTEVDKQREEMQLEHKGVVEHTRAEVRRLTKDAQQRQERLDADAEARRTQLAEEFDAAMKQQREQLEQEVSERQSASKAEADKLVREASEESERLRKQASEESERLRKQASDEAERLRREASEESERLRKTTEEDAEARERAANEEVQRLRTLRGEVLEQVRAAQQVLRNSASLLEPLDQEPANGAAPDQPAAPAPRDGDQSTGAGSAQQHGGQDGTAQQDTSQNSTNGGGKQSGNNRGGNKVRANSR